MSDTTFPTIILIAHLYKDFRKLYVTSTVGGVHAPGSYHYRGEAVDFGSGQGTGYDAMDAFAAWWAEHPGYLTELVHTRRTGYTGWFAKNYRRVLGILTYGYATLRAHRNHVHVAIATSGRAEQLLVLRVQQVLNLHADGLKGPITTAAVRSFQYAHHLKVDGVIGPATVEALRASKGW